MKRRFLVFITKLLRRLNSYIISENIRHKKTAVFLILSVVIILAFIQRAFINCGFSPPDLIFIPLMISSVFLGFFSFWFILPALLVRQVILSPSGPLSLNIWINEAFVVFKWLLLMVITVFAIYKYRKLIDYDLKFEQDLEMAKILQKTLVSKSFQIGHVKVIGYIRQSLLIGGDFYFFRPFKKKYIMLAIGDVMGKGITASIAMAIIMGLFYEWGKKTLSPSAIVEKINRRITSLWGESYLFSTLFYGIYNEETTEFSYSMAGHHNAVLLRAGQKVEMLEGEGIPVGIFRDNKWEGYSLKLIKGDKIILFTDGLYEVRNAKRDFHTFERLLEIMENCKELPAENIKTILLEGARNITGKHRSEDDRAIVILEIM